jgi:hypothetical protein
MSTLKQILQNSKLLGICALALAGAGCGSTVQPDFPSEAPRSTSTTRPSATPSESRERSAASDGARYDLSNDERRGGHTLEKHIGRRDDELRERLNRERNISAASTWTDRDAAEETVGEALRKDQEQISRWEARGDRRPNLALHFNAGRVIGRSLRHGATTSSPCTQAVIVLRADGPDGFYVLTAYPEDRQ